jgi:hypothetical protein
MYFRFRTLLNHPAFAHVPFPIEPSVFEIDLLATLEHGYERRDSYSPNPDVRKEHSATVQLLECLVAETEQGEVCDLSDQQTAELFAYATVMIAERRFQAAYCPACGETYRASSVSEVDFGYEEKSPVVCGQKYECPQRHVLFVFVRVNRLAHSDE